MTKRKKTSSDNMRRNVSPNNMPRGKVSSKRTNISNSQKRTGKSSSGNRSSSADRNRSGYDNYGYKDNLRHIDNYRKPKKRKLNYKRIIITAIVFFAIIFGIGRVIKSHHNKVVQNNRAEQQLREQTKKSDANVKKFLVMIDPGHGGNDKGAMSRDKKVFEKNIALQISNRVVEKLSKHKDVDVIMTRTGDEYVSLDDRVKMANEKMPDALVSIHLNAQGGNYESTGIETWYRGLPPVKKSRTRDDILKDSTGEKKVDKKVYGNDVVGADKGINYSQILAENLQSTIVSYVETKDRGTLKNIYEILRDTKSPAALIECGFITSREDEEKLVTSKYQDELAEGIAQGILSFLDSTKLDNEK